MIELLKRLIEGPRSFLAILCLIYAIIIAVFQIGLGQTLFSLLLLIIFALLLFILYQWVEVRKLRKKVGYGLASGQLKKYLNECGNPNLKIETIKQKTRISGVNVSVEREFIGRNVSNEHVSSFFLQAGGDKALTLNRLSLTVRDAKRNLPLQVEPIKDWEASILKILKAVFREPLEHDEEFDITLQYNWPGAIGQADYLIFTVSPYRRVDNAEFKIIFDADSKPNAWEFRGIKTGRIKKADEEIETEHDELELNFCLKDAGSEDYMFSFHI
jgi:hypothetical protein